MALYNQVMTGHVREEPNLISTGKAAKRLGVSRQTILNYIRRGLLSAVKIDDYYYVEVSSLVGFKKPQRGRPSQK